jgi:hypothetical protein
MGHSSIRVTADTYGHLIPSGNVGAIDSLDAKTSPQNSATQDATWVKLPKEEIPASC